MALTVLLTVLHGIDCLGLDLEDDDGAVGRILDRGLELLVRELGVGRLENAQVPPVLARERLEKGIQTPMARGRST